MGLTRIVEPAELAVSLAEAKKQCEVGADDTSHDSHITRLIKAATSGVERHTRRALITQTWKMTLREFPHYSPTHQARVYIPRPPLRSITSIIYAHEATGTPTTLNGSLYQTSIESKPGYTEPAFGESWPTVRPETVEAIAITYVAGYGAADIPAEFQNLIYELVAFRFFNRGDVDSAIPKHIRWAMDSLKCGAKYDYFGIKK